MTTNPNPSVYQPVTTYICGTGFGPATVDHVARPERDIAGNFLDDIGDWYGALQREQAPQRVLFALRAAYDAACWWTAELDKPRPQPPERPSPASA